MEKYGRLSLILMISLLIFVVSFSFLNRNKTPPVEYESPQISASEVKNLRRAPDSNTGKKYLLLLEGNSLCAYCIDSDTRTVIEKSEIEISSLTQADIQLLKNGVYAGSAEDLLLYFESYTS